MSHNRDRCISVTRANGNSVHRIKGKRLAAVRLGNWKLSFALTVVRSATNAGIKSFRALFNDRLLRNGPISIP